MTWKDVLYVLLLIVIIYGIPVVPMLLADYVNRWFLLLYVPIVVVIASVPKMRPEDDPY